MVATTPPTDSARPSSALPPHDKHKPRGTARVSTRGRWRAAVLVGVHVLAAVHIVHWQVAGTTLTPLEPSEAGETLTRGLVNAGFILFGLSILSTLILGRFFCGWGCHVVALQDFCAWLLRRVGIRPRPIRSRLLLLVPAYAALRMFVFPSLPLLMGWLGMAPSVPAPSLELELATDDFWARFPGVGIALLTFGVCGFLVVYFFGSKGFCTYGCPYGAIFGVADRLAPARIRVTDACEGCGHCTATCTSNVRVHEEVARFKQVVDAGCMKCLDCVSVCPKEALYFGLGPSRRSVTRDKKPKRKFDFTWPEEIAMALVFASAVYAFGNLYSLIPFLLTLGLAVLASLATVTLWRSLRSESFEFQSTRLKRAGRLSGRGYLSVGLAGLYLAFVAHSGFVQYQMRAGEQLFFDAGSPGTSPSARNTATSAAIAHLELAERYGFVEESRTHVLLGQLHFDRGTTEDVQLGRQHLERALELAPSLASPKLYLADDAMRRGDRKRALQWLADVLEFHPTHPEVAVRLQKLVMSDAADVDAVLMMVDVHEANGDAERARIGLEYVLERWPDRDDVRLRLEAYGQ